jgi:hypothetical protein
MNITICGSMVFAKEMLEVKGRLERNGHTCFVPDGIFDYLNGKVEKIGGSEGTKRKIANDLIRKHYNFIEKSEAVLVVNYEKNGIKNYIGGNSFLEIGFAYILGKKIFLLNEIPEIDLIKQEIDAIQPTVIHGNLDMII